jgi:hypothetical protein
LLAKVAEKSSVNKLAKQKFGMVRFNLKIDSVLANEQYQVKI